MYSLCFANFFIAQWNTWLALAPFFHGQMGLASIQGQEMSMNDLTDGWGEKVNENAGTKDKLP